MDLGPEAHIRVLPGMLVVSVRGTPTERQQQETLQAIEAALAAAEPPGLLYILDLESSVEGLTLLLALADHAVRGTRVAYAVSTAGQYAALREAAALAGPGNLAVFGEITAAYAFLSG